jgi:hypothetical protein
LFRRKPCSSRNPVRSTSYGVFCCLQFPCVPLTSTVFAYSVAYTRFGANPCLPASSRSESWCFVRPTHVPVPTSRGWTRPRPEGPAEWHQDSAVPLPTTEHRQGELPQRRPRYHASLMRDDRPPRPARRAPSSSTPILHALQIKATSGPYPADHLECSVTFRCRKGEVELDRCPIPESRCRGA